MKHLFLFPLALAIAAAPAHAQTTAMSVAGSVQSESKQPLSGAAITIIHLPSGTRHAAASDGTGHFAVGNLLAGGPYLIKVGEGGYRSQTVENIFLENGKTANFTVTLSKLEASTAKNRSGREPSAPPLALADAAIVGGPILLNDLVRQSKGKRKAATAVAALPVATAPVAATTAAPAAPGAATPVATAPVVPTPAAPNEPRPSRTPRYTSARTAADTRASDFVAPGHFDAKSGNYIYETGQPTTLKLADGNVIAGVGTQSTESHLYRFITDPQLQVDTVDLTRGWYSFDRVYFDAGKASLTDASLKQLRNVAALLRAYPRSRIKLGGYTDSTGSYKINKILSEDRAHAAWESLVSMGIAPTRIDTRGYGPRYSIAPNSTEEGRAMNRRLSVKVLQK